MIQKYSVNQFCNIRIQMLENPLLAILPPDQANLVLIMLISIPLSYILSLIYNKFLFLAMTMSLTIGIQSILFPEDRWYLWGQQQIVYLLVLFSPRKYVGHIVLVQSFMALTFLQAKRMYLNYGQNMFDITGIFCMQLFNYVGLAYNYQNGAKKQQNFSKQQLQRRVVQKPNYITYLGYVNFLPACLVGPVYEYADFQDYLNRRGDFTSLPNTLPAIVKQGGVFLISLVFYASTSFFPLSKVTDASFSQFALPFKFFYIVMCITHIQLKYVVAWSLGMVSMRASGFTYNPRKNQKNEKGEIVNYDFGRVQVNNMTKFYLEPNMKVKVDHWNISVQWALRRYIYQNIYNPKDYRDQKHRKKAQARAQLATVLVSALWHGIYPGYFVSFIHWIIYIQIFQQIYRLKKIEGSIIHQLSLKLGKGYDILENLSSTFAMTYFGMPFHLMSWANFLIFGRQTLFLPYILLYLGFFLIVQLKILGSGKKKQKIHGDKHQTTHGDKHQTEQKAKVEKRD